MPVPSAPTNVWAQNGDGYAYLSWAITPTATSYQIQRSTNGVSFSNLATSPVNNYSDESLLLSVAVDATALVVGNRYTITAVGTSTAADWTTLGLPTGVFAAIGVSFIAAATGAGSGSGTVQEYGNSYWYQVAGINGSGTGTFTNTDPNGFPLVVSPAPIGQTTLVDVRTQAKERADMVNSNFVSLPEWNKYITLAYKELYDLQIAAYGNDYYVKQPYTYTTAQSIDPNYNASVYPLPNDFYKLILCEVALNPADPNSWITLRQYERIQQNLWNYPNVYTFYGITNLRYRLTGTQLQIVPIPSANQTIRIWYAPRPARLVADTDLIDGISGWEEHIILNSARKALKKEESSEEAMALEAELAPMTARLEAMAANRNIAEPMKVSDSRTRNFSLGSEDGATGSGGGLY
jgi:hypothetical protein